MSTSLDTTAGAAVYTKRSLRIYDLFVLGFSNRFIWRCPTPRMLQFYNQHISANHLDVGVGTGYYLDKCAFPTETPRIALLDLNTESLQFTAHRIRRYQPTTHIADVLEPLMIDEPGFDSIALNYLLHCLPGTMQNKSVVFAHLKALLNDGGVLFGTTILGQDMQPNFLARRILKLYNQRGVFGNLQDNRADLEQNLSEHFNDFSVELVGLVAFFVGRN